MKNILGDLKFYDSNYKNYESTLDNCIFSYEGVKAFKQDLDDFIYKYGQISIGYIIEMSRMYTHHGLVRKPSFIAYKYYFTGYSFYKFEFDHQPKSIDDICFKLIIKDEEIKET